MRQSKKNVERQTAERDKIKNKSIKKERADRQYSMTHSKNKAKNNNNFNDCLIYTHLRRILAKKYL